MINQAQLQQSYSTSSSSSKDHQQMINIPVVIPSLSSEPTKTHHSDDDHHQVDELQVLLQADQTSTTPVYEIMTKEEPAEKMCDSSTSVRPPPPSEVSGREKLKRHRIEVAGRVWIPDLWGQEELLKDWIDCSAFDASLFPNGIMSARAALVEEGRRANSGGLRIENRCS
ncbi:hypothetical protein BVC80_1707g117 [Macleaya cordata]|uniref:Protein BIC1 n=1 Tax=Macleaya cordata TaxID=56857 RepID=A0A200Q6C0_MACCD|nr:hypothetical protein BVC80_1707g117 [Macleaya cordata]